MYFRRIALWTGAIVLWVTITAIAALFRPVAAAMPWLPVANTALVAAQSDVSELSVERSAVMAGADCSLTAPATEAEDGQSLPPGGYVATDGLGRARIGFAGGAGVTVYHDSCVQVTDVRRLMLLEGTLATQTGQDAAVVSAGNALITADGRVLIHLFPGRGLWVVVQEGSAKVDAEGKVVSLADDQQTWEEPGGELVGAKANERDVVGDRFFLIDDLTNDVIQDADLLVPPTAARTPEMPWGLVIALAAVAGGAAVIAVLSRRRGATTGGRETAGDAGEVVGLRSVQGAGYGDLIPLRQGGLSIGRAPNNHVVLNDSRVSARHARILARADAYYLEDLQSTNGTFVDGERVSRRALQHGDVIRFDRYQFVFQRGPHAPAQHEALPSPHSPQPASRAGVRLQDGSKPGHLILVDRDGLTLGRDASNDVVLHDSRASARHARIVAAEQGYYIEDLGSTNGTFVQGQRVTRQRLQGGETIQIGQSKLVFEFKQE